LYVLSDRARRISLKVKVSDREVHVIIPGLRHFKAAVKFAHESTDWINVQLESLPEPQPFIPNENILYRGQLYHLVKPEGRGRARIDNVGRKIIVPSPDLESFSGRVRRFLIREAREELEAATHHYANKLGKRVAKISVRDTSSRWGSCVTRKGEGHISYSWRLICAPAQNPSLLFRNRETSIFHESRNICITPTESPVGLGRINRITRREKIFH